MFKYVSIHLPKFMEEVLTKKQKYSICRLHTIELETPIEDREKQPGEYSYVNPDGFKHYIDTAYYEIIYTTDYHKVSDKIEKELEKVANKRKEEEELYRLKEIASKYKEIIAAKELLSKL